MSAQLKSFCCIEFPGYSDDPRTLIKMCGETKGIERAIKTQSPLVISLRPDVMARPIFGNQLSTGNLVVKLIKKRNKRTGEIKVDYEILGIATRTFRFRALADYQVLVDPQDPIYKLKEDLENWNSDAISKFRFTHEKGLVDPLRNYPPPAFSHTPLPLNYGYRQNPHVIKVMIRGKDTIQLVNRQKANRFICSTLSNLKVAEVPSSPPEDFMPADNVPQEAIEQIQQLFAKRPIWTRVAILNSLEAPEFRKHIKQLLPRVAYNMTRGPWRDCWVRYGFDPRKECEASAPYQMILLRISKPKEIRRAVREKLDPQNVDFNAISRTTHIFDGKHENAVNVYQLCDITYAEIRSFIDNHSTRNHFSKTSGWYSKRFISRVRALITRRIQKITEERLDSDDSDVSSLSPFSDGDTSDTTPEDSENDNVLDEDANEELEEPEVAEHVRSKVDEMMRNLQGLSQNNDDPEGFDAIADNDDLDMFDVYEEED